MLVGLTRTQRRRAGWFVALAYLFCVLAPTLSFALPGSQATPYCLTDEDHVPGMAHDHHEGAMHVHKDGHAHHHSGVQVHADSSADHDAKPVALKSDAGPVKAPHAADGKCCGLMCVTALPATLVTVAKPPVPNAVRVSDNHRKLADNAPSRLYRPPNS
ncbi:hypothetical protein OCA5_pOC16700160 (plasmid) [Afipia carboxidovorans OM5]|uniref:Uncharacterized protein n=1 Tax=Afipia carboxidovorans (strain ATCC 49405 / DSM 1227 / KCTC 32145 / OM5) TaxID=504832 RepID=F8C1A0_AFIC5|nr:hypothetical protein OCA4_pOC167B00160 [Afipia carboxidovorans OM4]AEI08215.1 hypothetical protein OCA5_pOC16700160 [Afipia carboxidovorans OM5]